MKTTIFDHTGTTFSESIIRNRNPPIIAFILDIFPNFPYDKKFGYILDLDNDEYTIGLAEGEITIPEAHRSGPINNPRDIADKVVDHIKTAIRSYMGAQDNQGG